MQCERTQEEVKGAQIALANAFPGPRAVMVELKDTQLAIIAVISLLGPVKIAQRTISHVLGRILVVRLVWVSKHDAWIRTRC